MNHSNAFRILAELVVLTTIFFLINLKAGENYRFAYESTKFSQPVFVGHGSLRYNPTAKQHIIIGYDIQNCVIYAPPQEQLISDVNIHVHHSDASAIYVGEKK